MNLSSLLKCSLWLVPIAAALFTVSACDSSKRKSTAPAIAAGPTAKTPPATAAKKAPVAKPGPTVDVAAKPAPAAKPKAAVKVEPKPVALKKPYDRKTLESAYLEISCIQKKGHATKLLAAYKKYGFGDPKAWMSAWKSQEKTKDYEQWLAALTQKAWKACP